MILDDRRVITLGRVGSTLTRDADYIKTATASGAVVLIKWGPLQTLYKFSSRDGKGQGPAKMWRIMPESLEQVRKWAKG